MAETERPPTSHIASQPEVIGVVGGVGPYAGLDLLAKVLVQTTASRDQDHLPVVSLSAPGEIPDRTEYLLGHIALNPAVPILDQIRRLSAAGATVAGIPCNTAHAAPIFDAIEAGLPGLARPPRLLHMIREVAAHLRQHLPGLKTVGLLSTTGTFRSGLYPSILEPLGFRVVLVDEPLQLEAIHPAIVDPAYGIKAAGRATERARSDLERGIAALRGGGAEAVILGCTELPLAFPEGVAAGLPVIDPTLILARALIREVAPEKLRPWESQGAPGSVVPPEPRS